MTKKAVSPTKKLLVKTFVPRPDKKTRQGNGLNSRPSHGRKLSRGQGR
jgi:hypothetical protein